MSDRRFRFYKGYLRCQFETDALKDTHGWRIGDIRLMPRYYFRHPLEVSEQEYAEALDNRYSMQTAGYPGIPMGDGLDAVPIHPHVWQKGDALVEFEPMDGSGYSEIVSEIYVEFPSGELGKAYTGWDFVAHHDGKYHGRLQGQAWIKLLEENPQEKQRRLEQFTFQEQESRSRKLTQLKNWVRPVNPEVKRLIGGNRGGCLSIPLGIGGGCGLPGCGLLSLLALLLGLLFGWDSCNKSAENIPPNPRVVHDTIYLEDERQIKELADTTIITQADAILLPNVQFYTNSARLLPYSLQAIEELADYLNRYPHLSALIKGHTDDVGDAGTNLKLSQDRAESVRQVLISLGVDGERVEAIGYGESRPKTTDQTIEGRALNRRVEVELKNVVPPDEAPES